MNQQNVGRFLKELRQEKGITQEQLASDLGVAGRTISRWETGSNMPDISLVLELAQYYEVEVIEILDGERKGENMNDDLTETMEKVADYSAECCLNDVVLHICIASLAIWGLYMASKFFDVPNVFMNCVMELFFGATMVAMYKYKRTKMHLLIMVLSLICVCLDILIIVLKFIK